MHGPPRNRKAGTSVRSYPLHVHSCYVDKEKPKNAGIDWPICIRGVAERMEKVVAVVS